MEQEQNPLFSGLNPMQLEAVKTTDGPILVLAGAGSGKTMALTHRLAYIVQQGKASTQNILAVTFTNKAAEEMKSRVAKLLKDLNSPMYKIEKQNDLLPWIGTFHSICVRILRAHIEEIGYKRNFSIYDSDDQVSAIKAIMKSLEIDPKQYSPGMVHAMISSAKNQLIEADEYAHISSSAFQQQVVARVYKYYEKTLKESNALDFDDLILLTVKLFRTKPLVLESYQKLFEYILVDEYQDTNKPQYELVKMLAEGYRNVCVVGDPDQSIYAWRGADINNILSFEKDWPDAVTIRMEQNYRSTKNILAAADKVISKNKVRKEKTLWTDNPEGDPVVIKELHNERAEAEFILKEIERTCGGQIRINKFAPQGAAKLSDFVVLYRTHAQSRVVEETLLSWGVPYRIVGGTRFYERREVKDIMAYLKIIRNPADLVSLRRVINVPPRRISQQTVEALERLGKLTNLEEANDAEVARAKIAIDAFTKILDDLRAKSKTLDIVELIDYLLETIHYETYIVEGNVDGEERWANVMELRSIAEDFAPAGPEASLTAFLEEVALMTDLDHSARKDFGSDMVTLMTLHNAKGLEFNYVFMVGMEEGVFPHSRSLCDELELEEERRLCYVGITRAKKKLFMLHTGVRQLYGNVSANPPSRFLADIREGAQTEESTIKGDISYEPDGEQEEIVVNLKAGDRVRHKAFGDGIVISVKGTIVEVAFAGRGAKKLDLNFAPLDKI